MSKNLTHQLNEKTRKAICPDGGPFKICDHQVKGLLARVQPAGGITYFGLPLLKCAFPKVKKTIDEIFCRLSSSR